MTTTQYITTINNRYKLGNATEHTFRGDLQRLLETLLPEISVTNEPKRQKCGAPDYILTRKNIPIGFIEAKDVGDKDLEGKKKTGNKEQFDRYKSSLDNLIFTDYLDFHFYRDGEQYAKIAIGTIENGQIKPITENFSEFENRIKVFATHVGQNIKSSKRLAEMMAGKARLLSDIIEKSLTSDTDNCEDSTLKQQMNAFKQYLIHDITPKGFADVYAQTIAYGMFAARLNDTSLDNFSRQKAAELIPKSNPFLRKLFGYIAGPDIDDRIRWIVDGLADIFLHTNVQEILKTYGKATKTEDPIIHFYETFLSEYDAALRKTRGVWYTPAPVVEFIVRAVDEILKRDFGLSEGLADTSKTTIKVGVQETDKRFKDNIKTAEQEVHRVQILDPATGTGTFLAEVVKHIHKKFVGMQGIWSNYVESNLLPRLNGFELLMASYAMAHLQLDLLLKEKGYVPTKDQRLRVYLTNSLEEHHPDTGTLFASWLSTEANEANHIKRDTPVMCVIGNPPYSGESANKGEWIMNLMEDYKKEPGGKQKLQERNPKWINDDYVKFIRYGQHFIEKNGSGILAFINPHGFLDNPTFRGMRWHLLKTFDKIYTIDLHGNSKKKEVSPDGSPDQNVFDIMQGVSINIFVKTGEKKKNELSKLFHCDLWGKRQGKYDFLYENSLQSIKWTEIEYSETEKNYFFVPKDFALIGDYEKGFKISELFLQYNAGIVTAKDAILINDTKKGLIESVEKFYNINADENLIRSISYRPFDNKFVYYDAKLIERARKDIMQHFVKGDNLGFAGIRINKEKDDIGYSGVFVTKSIAEARLADRFLTSIFPLYLYPENNLLETDRIPNLKKEIVSEIEKQIGETFEPIDLLDYIYAVLYSPTYRERYKEFLKIDFPRVPYPQNAEQFWAFVKLGATLRKLHLMENVETGQGIATYPINGNNEIDKPIFKDNKVYINETQYFDNVPAEVWNFYIGGYQPAQKWLKDRKGRVLGFEDILHYQKIICVLKETGEVMEEIDKIMEE
ncbi:MAG: DNA methyltransferase [Dysgonamonadaceae bacterium]|jgi:predicted helicase|nr:DNA methyltransferase [Dysgonamonadaceae bacterium]